MNETVKKQFVDLIRNDAQVLRLRIRFDAADGLDPNEAHKKMCQMFGHDVMTFPDYDFWYNRFRNGHFDIDYDRSNDEKLRGMEHLPNELLEKIALGVDLIERQSLRKVNRKFKTIVETGNASCKTISLSSNSSGSRLFVDNYQIEYTKNMNAPPGQQFKDCLVLFNNREKVVSNVTHFDQASEDAYLFLKNSSLELDKFEVINHYNHYPGSLKKFEEKLKSIEGGVHATKVTIESYWDHLKTEMAILPYIKPHALEEIELIMRLGESPKEIEECLKAVGEMDQIKTANTVKIKWWATKFIFPIENFTGCKKLVLDVILYQFPLKENYFVRFKNVLLKRHVRISELVIIFRPQTSVLDIIRKLAGDKKHVVRVEGRDDVVHCKLPKTTDYLEIGQIPPITNDSSMIFFKWHQHPMNADISQRNQFECCQ